MILMVSEPKNTFVWEEVWTFGPYSHPTPRLVKGQQFLVPFP